MGWELALSLKGPTGDRGPSGNNGSEGIQGIPGNPGDSFSSLYVASSGSYGSPDILTPTSFTLSNYSDAVSISETYNLAQEGVYFQVALPDTGSNTSISVNFTIGGSRIYGIQIAYPNTVQIVADDAVVGSHTYDNGNIVSIYFDGQNVNYRIDTTSGSGPYSYSVVSPTPAPVLFSVSYDSLIDTYFYLFNNFRMYPTGLLGPTGAQGAQGPAGGICSILDGSVDQDLDMPDNGNILILNDGSTLGKQTFTVRNAPPTPVYVLLKNSSSNNIAIKYDHGGTLTTLGTLYPGNGTTTNSSLQVLYWSGTDLKLY